MRIGTHIGYKIPPLRGYKSILTLGETTLPSDITFSRGTNATLTDSNGRVAYAPHNLLTNSEDFEAAAWIKTNVTVTPNATTAPDGTVTADLVYPSSTGTNRWINQSVLASAAVYTYSIRLKFSGIRWVFILKSDGSAGAAWFDVENGVVGTVAAGYTATISPAGNGFYTCSVTAPSASPGFLLYTGLSSADNSLSVTANGTNGVFFWGAQLNIANAPVNLLTWSEDFTNAAWTKRGTCAVTPNAIAAPDGTITADLISGLNTSGNDLYSTVATVPLNSPASPSFYINKVSATGTVRVGNPSDSAKGAWNVNLALVDSGWQRITLTHPAVTVVTSFVGNGSGDGLIFLAQAGGPLSFYLWGAQLNTGSVALPYVATTSSIYLPPAYNSTTPKNLLGFTQEPENAAWTKSNSYVQQNLLTWSQDFDNAAWVKSFGGTGVVPTVTANAAIAPDGTTTADSIVFNRGAGNTGTDQSVLSQAVAVSSGAHTQTVWLKAATPSDVGKQLALRNVAAGSYGAVTLTADWVRYTRTETGAVTTWEIANRGTFTADNTVTALVWGAQLVQGSTAGDYTQTTSAAAPTRYVNWDGTLTGRKLVENTAAALHYVEQSAATVASTPCTLSVYLKAAERTWAVLQMVGSVVTPSIYIDLSNGLFGTQTGSLTPTSVPVGNGWYRLTLTATTDTTATRLRIYTASANNGTTYTGDGTSGIYVSDFQLSNSASVDPYVYNPQAAAASTAYYGPRFDYDPVTLAAKGLLIEEQRTNLLLYAEQFDNGVWSKAANCTVTPDNTSAPDGAITADRIVISAANAISGPSNTAGTFSGLHTQSWYVKQAATVRYVQLLWTSVGVSSDYANFDLQTGTLTAGTYSSANIQNVGNGWYRISLTSTLAAVSGGCWIIAINTSNATRAGSYPGTGAESFFIWGAQLEAGSFATSYIPTVASQVTRNADSASMLGDNFYTWYNPNQGTFLGVGSINVATANSGSAGTASDGTNNNRVLIGFEPSVQGFVAVGGVAQVSLLGGTAAINVVNRVAFAVKANDFALTLNGAAVVTDVSGAMPAVDRFNIGANGFGTGSFMNGHIRRIGYYNTRLADSTLQALTT